MMFGQDAIRGKVFQRCSALLAISVEVRIPGESAPEELQGILLKAENRIAIDQPILA